MHDQRLERLTYFSDAVFAIAMTLLVIELHVPEVHGQGDIAFLQALADMTPNFVGFLVSFFVIGSFWAGHHRGFGLTTHYAPSLAWANMWLLLAVVFLPFSTALMSDYYGARVPHIFYLANLAAAGLLQRLLMVRALAPGLIDAEADRQAARVNLSRLWAVPIGTGIAIVTAFFWPAMSTFMLILIWPLTRLLEGRARATE